MLERSTKMLELSEAPIKLIYLGDTERLTTEMGERRGCENLTDHRNDVTWGLV